MTAAESNPPMWHHYCPAEGAWLGVAAGQPCNWCDTPPTPAEQLKAALR